MSEELRTARPRPCASCPYRKDVPSGVWDASEYDKLPKFDGETWEQDPSLFLCHQGDGHLCSGWLACHDPRELFALRIHRVDPSVYDYETDVEVFSSGAEAAEHGKREIDNPSYEARLTVDKVSRAHDARGIASVEDVP